MRSAFRMFLWLALSGIVLGAMASRMSPMGAGDGGGEAADSAMAVAPDVTAGMDSLANDSLSPATDTVPAKEKEEPVNEASIVDEVIWVVGDAPILLSDVEMARLQGEMEGIKWDGDPDCTIPEQLAIQKLFLHQAEIDSVEVSEPEVAQSVERQINYWLQMVDGNRERLEEYKKSTISEMRL